MVVKISLEEYKAKINSINPNIEILDEFIKESGKAKKRYAKCRCKIDGYQWEASFNSLCTGTGCPECGGVRRDYTINDIRKKVFEINPNIEILSDEYKGCKVHLKCRCKIDGYVWGVTWGHLAEGRGCPECAGKRNDYTINDIKEKVYKINPNIKIISTEYKGCNEKIKCECLLDGHEWKVKSRSLLGGGGCPKCAGNIKHTIEEIKNKLKDLNKDIIILSDKYVGVKNKLQCKCLKHNYIWQTSWASLSKGNGCPECVKLKYRRELSPNWKGGITSIRNHLRHSIGEWKKTAMEESNYKCVITGKKFDVIHHVYSYNSIIKETIEITGLPIYENIGEYTKEELQLIEYVCIDLHNKYPTGVCLCDEEHRLFHRIYGRGNNTAEQFEEFLKTRGGAIDGATN